MLKLFLSTVILEAAPYAIAMYTVNSMKVLKGGYCMITLRAIIGTTLSKCYEKRTRQSGIGLASHELRDLSWPQSHFSSSSNQTGKSREHLYNDGMTRHKVYRIDAESAEVRMSVQIRLWRKLCQCVRFRHCGRYDVLQWLACLL